jgi:Ca2+-binding EF-hand superfamily protein
LKGSRNPQEKRMTRFLIMSVLAVVAINLSASAQQGAEKESLWDFYSKKYDSNKDGSISKDEYNRQGDAFTRLDTNQDGRLTEPDFAGRTGGNRRRRGGRQSSGRSSSVVLKRFLLSSADKNNDESVDAKEWSNLKATVDTDNNDVISEDELAKVRGRKRMMSMLVRRLDKDQDGKVTAKEFSDSLGSLDADKSGAFEAKEIASQGRRQPNRSGNARRRNGRGSNQTKDVPQPGEQAPDFKLPVLGVGKKTAQLSSFIGQKPVALIFGSYT